MCKKGYKYGLMDESHRKAISLATTGLKKPTMIGNQNSKGHIPWNKGKELPQWVKTKLSLAKGGKITKKCVICGSTFQTIKSRKWKCCSQKCARVLASRYNRKKGTYKDCLGCGKQYYIRPHQIKTSKYCSLKCGNKHIWNSRRKEMIEKLRKANSGRTPWNKGRKFPQYSGKNHPAWRNGISFEPYGLDFNRALKNRIRQRDNYQCQLCGLKENGKNQIAHHIDYDKNNNDENNLILLCNSCHSKTNFNRIYWIQFFRGEIYEALEKI